MKQEFFYVIMLFLIVGCHNLPMPENQPQLEDQSSQEYQSQQEYQPRQENPSAPVYEPQRVKPIEISKTTSRSKKRKPEVKNPMNNRADEFSYTVVNETPYYLDGPQQQRPEDGSFAKGTKLKLIKAAGSYSLVESQEGIKAYVVVDDIEKAND